MPKGLSRPSGLVDGPVKTFFDRLHDLHEQAGRPSLAEIRKRGLKADLAELPTSTTHDAMTKKLADWEVYRRIVAVLGGNEDAFRNLYGAAESQPSLDRRTVHVQHEPQNVPASAARGESTGPADAAPPDFEPAGPALALVPAVRKLDETPTAETPIPDVATLGPTPAQRRTRRAVLLAGLVVAGLAVAVVLLAAGALRDRTGQTDRVALPPAAGLPTSTPLAGQSGPVDKTKPPGTPSLTLSRTSGSATSGFDVDGSGWPAGRQVNIIVRRTDGNQQDQYSAAPGTGPTFSTSVNPSGGLNDGPFGAIGSGHLTPGIYLVRGQTIGGDVTSTWTTYTVTG